MKYFGLTTKDNPYNVFNDFTNWMSYDHQKGYFTAELLARIARTSDELSDEDNQAEIERAIDEIIALHPVPKGSENDEKEEENDTKSIIEYVKVIKEG